MEAIDNRSSSSPRGICEAEFEDEKPAQGYQGKNPCSEITDRLSKKNKQSLVFLRSDQTDVRRKSSIGDCASCLYITL